MQIENVCIKYTHSGTLEFTWKENLIKKNIV